MNRRGFLVGAAATAGVVSVGGLPACVTRETRRYGSIEMVRRRPASGAPNVVFISIDDCNDWVGFLNPHPGTLTPNLDALAARSLSFDHAYCASPMCGPARVAVGFGVHPFQSGVYDHSPASHEAYAEFQKVTPTLIDDFWAAGYNTVGAGKILHGQLAPRWDRYRHTVQYLSGHLRKDPNADPSRSDPAWLSPYDGQPIGSGEHFTYDQIDFGPSGISADLEPDGKAADWVCQQLRDMPRRTVLPGLRQLHPPRAHADPAEVLRHAPARGGRAPRDPPR